MSDQWRDRRERGSRGAIRLIIWLALCTGRRFSRILLVPICAYFFVTAPSQRKASREFLDRALGHKATARDFFRHLFVFSTTLLDRIYLMHGRHHELTIDVINDTALWHALALGRGCLLLGSHLGSFEMLALVGSTQEKLIINMVMHVDEGAQLGALIQKEPSALPYRIIPLGQPGSMLRVKECLDRGEVVGILADRVYANEMTQRLPFLGCPARFSLGPLRLAKITGAPVVTVFGLFRGGQRYEIVFESLAERVVDAQTGNTQVVPQPVAANAVSLPACLATYVQCLEHQARRCPYNWFNFYDYWSS